MFTQSLGTKFQINKIFINEGIKRAVDRLHHQIKIRPPSYRSRAPIVRKQQDFGTDFWVVAVVDQESILSQIRQKCSVEITTYVEAADIVAETNQEEIRFEIFEGT